VLSHSNETPAETRTEVCTTPSFIYIYIYMAKFFGDLQGASQQG